MTHSSTHAADTRAAQAALTRHPFDDVDCYLMIDDSDEDITQIISVVREYAWRGLESLS